MPFFFFILVCLEYQNQVLYRIWDFLSHLSYLIKMLFWSTDISNGHFAGVRDQTLEFACDRLLLVIVALEADLVELLRHLLCKLVRHQTQAQQIFRL